MLDHTYDITFPVSITKERKVWKTSSLLSHKVCTFSQKNIPLTTPWKTWFNWNWLRFWASYLGVSFLISGVFAFRSVAAGAVGASLGGVPGLSSSSVTNGLRNHHVHSSTCSHNHQSHSSGGSLPLGLGNLGLPGHGSRDRDHTA